MMVLSPDSYVLDENFHRQLISIYGDGEGPDSLKVKVPRLQALYFELLGRPIEADQIRKKILSKNNRPGMRGFYVLPRPAPPGKWSPYVDQADRALSLWNLEEAEEWVKKAEKAGSPRGDFLWVSAVIAMKRKSWGEAEELLREAVSLPERRPETFAFLGELAESRGNFALAEFYYAQALRYDPEFEHAIIGIGKAKFRHRGSSAALAYLRHLKNQFPKNAAVWIAIGDAHGQAAHYSDAMEAYQKASELDPTGFFPLLRVGNRAREEALIALDEEVKSERLWLAVKSYRRHAELFPWSQESAMEEAQLYFRMRWLDEAKEAYLQARKLAPRQPEIHFRLAQLARNLGKAEEARELLDKEIALHPRSDDAWVEKGNMAMSAKEFEKAAANFAEAYRINPRNAEALFGGGVAHHLMGDYDAAMALLQHALVEDPGRADYYYQLGLLAEKMGRKGEAIHAFTMFRTLTREPASIKRATQKIEQLQ